MATPKQNFVDDSVLAIVHRLETLDVLIESANLDWNGGVSGEFANDTTPYDDGYPNAGHRQFDEALVHTAMGKFDNIAAIILPLREGLRKMARRTRGEI